MDNHLNEARRIAVQHGFSYVSRQGWGRHAIYRFRCVDGHEWDRAGARVLRFKRLECPHCRQQTRLARIRDIARAMGGDCLESTFQGARPHRLVCARGHTWSEREYKLQRGYWCPQCQIDDRRGDTPSCTSAPVAVLDQTLR